jgi:hypothetical protein
MTDIELEALASVVAKKVLAVVEPIVKKNAFRKSVKLQTAADTLECSTDKIYDLINSGELEVVPIKGTKYITIKSLVKVQTPK